MGVGVGMGTTMDMAAEEYALGDAEGEVVVASAGPEVAGVLKAGNGDRDDEDNEDGFRNVSSCCCCCCESDSFLPGKNRSGLISPPSAPQDPRIMMYRATRHTQHRSLFKPPPTTLRAPVLEQPSVSPNYSSNGVSMSLVSLLSDTASP